MSRTARLFELLDSLRRHRTTVTAANLADDLRVSVRTVYRDIATLSALGAPIDGEAGVGYLLRPGFFLPPLMFDEDELEALVLGARWVERQNDEALGRAARNALAKIAAAAPGDLRDRIGATGLFAPARCGGATDRISLQPIREAIRREEKIAISYVDQAGAATKRTIWPIALTFYEDARTVAAWCELRVDFRHFRCDRIEAVSVTGERYPERRSALVKTWRRKLDEDRAKAAAQRARETPGEAA